MTRATPVQQPLSGAAASSARATRHIELSPELVLPPFMTLDELPIAEIEPTEPDTVLVDGMQHAQARTANRIYGHLIDELVVLAGMLAIVVVLLTISSVQSVRALLDSIIADQAGWQWSWPDLSMQRLLISGLIWSYLTQGLALASSGRTIGKGLNGVRILGHRGGPPNALSASVRWLLPHAMLAAVLIAFGNLPLGAYALLWAMGQATRIPFGASRQGLHERLTRTVAIDDRIGTVHARASAPALLADHTSIAFSTLPR